MGRDLKRKKATIKPAVSTSVDDGRLRRIYHEPRPGRPVRLLDPEGEEVEIDPWWKRRIKDGDVVVVHAPPVTPAPSSTGSRRRKPQRPKPTVETFTDGGDD